MDPRKRILRYIYKYKVRLLVAIIAGILIAGCTTVIACLIGSFTDIRQGKSARENPLVIFGFKHGWFSLAHADIALLIMVAVFVVIIYIPKDIFTYTNSYLIASLTNRVGADVRRDIYSHLQTLPLSFFHKNRIGDLLSRMTNDVGLIQNSSQLITQAIDAPAMVIVGLIAMFKISWQLALVTIVFVPIIGIAIQRLAEKIRSLTTTTQKRLADVNSVVEESIRGIRIIRSFGTEEQEIKRFAKANNNSLFAALTAAKRSSLVYPTVEFMGAFSASLVTLIGGSMLVRGAITFRDLIIFAIMALNVANSGKQFGRLTVTYQQIMAGAERIFDLLDTKSDLLEPENPVVLKDVEGRVEFKDVTFEYNQGECVLDNLSFVINPGEVVAIVGPSGAGKSTIADLIPRFYDVTAGQILVEGHDIRDIETKSLREHIAMVPQETILFSGTIADNISYGRPGADMSEIIDAAKAANAHDFIVKEPNGYNTMLGEFGVGLSGGQRQRISIARALLKNPKILILDEATSSLDAASEGIVQDALDKLMDGRSTLVIAHRLSTVTGADRILVLDHGSVVESGSFEDLIGNGGVFSQLYRTQFRTEETNE